MKVSVHGTGKMEDGMPAVVEMRNILFLRDFEPYIKARKQLK